MLNKLLKKNNNLRNNKIIDIKYFLYIQYFKRNKKLVPITFFECGEKTFFKSFLSTSLQFCRHPSSSWLADRRDNIDVYMDS
jgi:hypothetical protein